MNIGLPELSKAVHKMSNSESPFEQKLAELFLAADMDQLLKLREAFSEELKKFL